MPALRNAKTRAYVIANPMPAAIRLNAGENIETGFEPISPALCDLECLVLGVIGGEHAVNHAFVSIHGEIGVQLNHGVAGRDRIVAIDLDFVVVLGECSDTKQYRS